jgi:hypothetical protein
MDSHLFCFPFFARIRFVRKDFWEGCVALSKGSDRWSLSYIIRKKSGMKFKISMIIMTVRETIRFGLCEKDKARVLLSVDLA